jgi:hypothetical protein
VIIFDFSQVCLANIMVQYANLKDDEGQLSKDLFRKMILNTIRKNVSKFRSDYGRDVVIACDTYASWRKDYFPYYKANRKKGRDESDLDWPFIFECMRDLKAELKEYFPYRVIEVDRAEADDVIGTLAHAYGVPLGNGREKVLILSGDKDFIQLQKYSNVRQYSPVGMKVGFITNNDPEEYLLEHVIKGDKGDGIPNAMSADETFIKPGGRNMTLTAKRMAGLKDAVKAGTCTEVGYFRNELLIDLSRTPETIKAGIMEAYEAQAGKTRLKLLTYFTKYRLSSLVEQLSDF